ncbi:hypothetical protein GA0061100_114139 [Rhizobium hainanense]|uniref:Uncharacterized protein n=1 Tax=Rhizobium hainanense TaxID=52131 RepID=A0A1C3WAG5_9HYPH|nr:hypothetical protein GA0061100_113129 [Rhizobium hainanense]SCB37366.1 hypothetical protein GA0061100_114139 [Rhizobium hainanense]
MLLNYKCGLLVATAVVDMTLRGEIGLSRLAWNPAFRSRVWRWSTALMLILFGNG